MGDEPDGNMAEGAGNVALAGGEVPPVRLRNVTYSIRDTLILDDVSLSVEAGEVFGIMGMSGSGKSTLLRLMMGLIRPDSGSVEIAGEDISRMGERELTEVRQKLGMCFQYAALFDSMTVADNVGFGLRRLGRRSKAEIRDIVSDCLDRVGMTGSEELYPSELSGGMKKRVGIARAVASEPEIVLYDEPSSGLDPVVASVIDGLIVHLADDLGVTSVVVSHHVENLFTVADRVLMLHEHRVEQIGSPEDLRDRPTEIADQFVHGRPTGPIVV